jgi:hypothetical protein
MATSLPIYKEVYVSQLEKSCQSVKCAKFVYHPSGQRDDRYFLLQTIFLLKMVIVNDFIRFFAQCKNFSNIQVIFARDSPFFGSSLLSLIDSLINKRKGMGQR